MAYNISNLQTPNPNSLTMDPAFNASAWEEYRVNKTGPLTFARGNSLAMVPLPVVDPKNYRDLARQVRNQKNDAYLPTIYQNSKKLLKGVTAQRKVLAKLFQNDEAAIVEMPITASGTFILLGL